MTGPTIVGCKHFAAQSPSPRKTIHDFTASPLYKSMSKRKARGRESHARRVIDGTMKRYTKALTTFFGGTADLVYAHAAGPLVSFGSSEHGAHSITGWILGVSLSQQRIAQLSGLINIAVFVHVPHLILLMTDNIISAFSRNNI